MYRETKFHNAQIAKLLNEKQELYESGRIDNFKALLADALSFEVDFSDEETLKLIKTIKQEKDKDEFKQTMEKERNKKALKIQQIQDKIVPIVLKNVPLGEFEELDRIESKGGQIHVQIIDRIAHFKEIFLKQKAKKESSTS